MRDITGRRTAHYRPSLDGVNVLVVDDIADCRAVCRDILVLLGAVVVEASCVDSALTIVAETGPHVVVSDLSMPGRTGFDLVASLRALGVTTPVVGVTGSPDDRDRAAGAGFDRCFLKPIDWSRFVETVAEFATRR
jgi:CheY-like chemotaxis protein